MKIVADFWQRVGRILDLKWFNMKVWEIDQRTPQKVKTT